jgi:hypothetical protein
MRSDFVNKVFTLDGKAVQWTDIWVNQDFQNYPIYVKAANTKPL